MKDDRPVLLLLHDEGRDAGTWREFVPLFETRFRVIAPDLPAGDEDHRLARVRERLDGGRVGVIGHGTGGVLAQALAVEGRVDALVLLGAPRREGVSDDDLAAFDFPVLLLWGEDDDAVPVSTAEALNDAIPTSTLGLLPGCGHDLPGEAAATIAPIIFEYLRARYLREPHGHPDAGIVGIQLERRPPWVDLEEDERDEWFDMDDDEETVP